MSIDLVFQFLGEQWLLVVALIATLTMLVLHEGRKAGPALSINEAVQLVNVEGGVFLDIRDAGDFAADTSLMHYIFPRPLLPIVAPSWRSFAISPSWSYVKWVNRRGRHQDAARAGFRSVAKAGWRHDGVGCAKTAGGDSVSEVMIYTTRWCPFCIRAKALLDQKGVEYQEIPVDGDPSTRHRWPSGPDKHRSHRFGLVNNTLADVTSCMVSSVQAALIRCWRKSVARLDLIEKESLHG